MIDRDNKLFLNSIFEIDMDAGEYLMEKFNFDVNLRGRDHKARLKNLFVWDFSPQGHNYWYEIYLLLERSYG